MYKSDMAVSSLFAVCYEREVTFLRYFNVKWKNRKIGGVKALNTAFKESG